MKEEYMKLALKEALKAKEKQEIPIGAIIVKDGKVIARGYNKRELSNDATEHAEIIAIKKACKKLNNWRLNDCELYVTLEPCPMCAGAVLNSRIKKVFFGASDSKSGGIISNYNLLDKECLNHRVEYEAGIIKEECENIIKSFFKERRKDT